jgi:hypothetical protein
MSFLILVNVVASIDWKKKMFSVKFSECYLHITLLDASSVLVHHADV